VAATPGNSIDRLRLNFDTSDLDAYDYIRMDWYTVAAARRLPTITGPYLDYSGADRLVLTLTMPTVVHNHLVGVVRNGPTRLSDRRTIASQLCGIKPDAVLVNRDRSVIATNSRAGCPAKGCISSQPPEISGFAAAGPLDDWTAGSWGVVHATLMGPSPPVGIVTDYQVPDRSPRERF